MSRPPPHRRAGAIQFLFRAAARLGRSVGEFQALPRAERIGWLCYEELEMWASNPGLREGG